MGFSRQEYWSGLPFPSPRALPDPGMEPGSPALQVDSLPSETPYVCFLCIFICLLVRSGNGEHSPLVHIFPFLRYNLHIVKKKVRVAQCCSNCEEIHHVQGQRSLSKTVDMEQQTGSKSGKECLKAVHCHPANYLTYMQSTS